jgi:hypothetical protein
MVAFLLAAAEQVSAAADFAATGDSGISRRRHAPNEAWREEHRQVLSAE